MISNLTLRLATPDDAMQIACLSRDRIEYGLGWSWTASRVLRSIRDASTNVVVAQDATHLVGFGMMKYHDEEAHLLLLAVHAQSSRLGVASALVDWLERSALIAGVGQVYLEARQTNGAAREFYAKRGYQEIQTLAGYYQGLESCVRLAKDLWLQSPGTG
jgi:ribosomal protein S18 acetylase RimI-like enzyme